WRTSRHKIRERAVGGKAWNLFRLCSYGFPVPPFCVVSTSVLDEALRSRQPEIEAGLKTLGAQSVEEVEQFSRSLMDFIQGVQFSREFRQEIRGVLTSLFGQSGRFAVRSSIVGEDAVRHSFAGQMDSFLDVPEMHLFEAIKKVWASAFSPRALLYRREKRVQEDEIAAAVIIQEMVRSVASGILFTRHPDSRGRECIISAGFGLGEGVVSNRIETDTYRIPWQGGAIVKKVAIKDYRVTGKKQVQGGTEVERVPETMKSEPVLTEAQVRALQDIGVKAERSFGLPLDIEWAFDSQGKLFVLQARPIVFAEDFPSPTLQRLWDNSNIVESYPGVTLPLTFSFVRRCYEIIFRDAATKLTLARKVLNQRQDIFPNMIGLLDGRVYYNLLNWYTMQACFPGFNKYKDSWDRMIGISQNTPFSRRRFSFIHALSSTLKLCWIMLAVKRTAGKFFRSFNRAYDKFKDIDFARATEHDLLALYEALDREFSRKWYLTLYNDFCAIKYYDWLKTLCAKWTNEKTNNLQNSLLCGVREMESVAPVRSLARLAEMIHSKPDYRNLFGQNDDHKIWPAIQQNPALAPLKAALTAYLKAYGDRSLEELKLEKPTFREEPTQLIRLIRDFLHSGLSPELMDHKDQKIRREAEAAVKRHLRNPFKRLAFGFVLKNARRAVAQRENMRFARTRLFGIIRRLFSRLGKLLEENGFLDSAPDIYYLTVEEVFSLIQGTAVTQNLRGLVTLRKAEYERYAQKSPRARFETTGIPYLHSAYEEKAGRDGNKRLKGISCSSGRAWGTAKVVIDPRLARGNGNSILVAQSTDPGWVFLMISAKGIVTERGSVLSHTAIIGRELGIPTIVGVKDATKLIPDGASLCIDGGTGDVQWQ
ncbi:MAG: PEP/pyruvate-binding domain-containing protein, partial [Acidobacteriota bacterium]